MPWTLRSAVTSTRRPRFYKGFGGAGVLFQKKSKHGMATPKPDLDIIRERLKVAEQLVKEMRDA